MALSVSVGCVYYFFHFFCRDKKSLVSFESGFFESPCVITVITCRIFRLILAIDNFKVVSYSTFSRNQYFEIKID